MYKSVDKFVSNLNEDRVPQEELTEGVLSDVIDFFHRKKNEVMDWVNRLRTGGDSFQKRQEEHLRNTLRSSGYDVPDTQSGLLNKFKQSFMAPILNKIADIIRTVLRINNPQDPITVTADIVLIAGGTVAMLAGAWKLAVLFLVLKSYANATNLINRNFESTNETTEKKISRNIK